MKIENQHFTNQIIKLEFLVSEMIKRNSADLAEKDGMQAQALEELSVALEELSVAEEELQNANLQLEINHQQIEAEHGRYLELFNFAPDTYLVTNAEGVIEEANIAAEAMFKIRPNLLVGKPVLLLLAEEEHKNFHTRLSKILNEGQTKVQDWQLKAQSRSGNSFPASMHISIKHNPQGEVIYLRWLIHDLTKSNRLQEEVVMLQKLEAVGRLAMGVAHDFNNLLAVISGYSQLALQQANAGRPINREIDEIDMAVQHGARLTKQLLAFTRNQKVEPTVLQLNALVNNLQEILSRFLGENIEIVQNLQEELWNIKADYGQLEQVLINLAINSRDALPNGGGLTIATFNLLLEESEELRRDNIPPGSYVCLSVSDTGTGISDDIKPHIFEPFFTTKKHGKGTGLGLATIHEVVTQSGGYIRVRSKVGSGTTFELLFPRVEEALAVAIAQTQPEPLKTIEKTVLFVEDDPAIRRMLEIILQSDGFKTLCAEDGEAALRLLQESAGEKIDLLLTDIMMPKMNGKELAKQLLEILPDLKILFMSGYDYESTSEEDAILPANFIQKPFLPNALSAKLREILGTEN
jgi:PAS domain S-box-containing protein